MLQINIPFVNRDIKDCIDDYENYVSANDFSTQYCPKCKIKGKFKRNTKYQRNLTYKNNEEIVNDVMTIYVVECRSCGRYHALLPGFLFPYHIFSAPIIVEVLHQRLCNSLKLLKIVDKYKITHQLMYYWLKLLRKFQGYISTVFDEIVLQLVDQLNKMFDDLELFTKNFHIQHKFMFFLFKMRAQ